MGLRDMGGRRAAQSVGIRVIDADIGSVARVLDEQVAEVIAPNGSPSVPNAEPTPSGSAACSLRTSTSTAPPAGQMFHHQGTLTT
jgi:hypothetical protein